jgi:hypothetical protein
MLDDIYDSDIRILFTILDNAFFMLDSLDYLYGKGLREGDMLVLLGAGINYLLELREKDFEKFSRIKGLIRGGLIMI